MNKELQDAFRELVKRDVDTFPVTVLSVDKSKGTCVVNDGELDYTDVQLAAVVDETASRFYLFPKVGSSVLVSPVNEDIHRLYVEAYSEIESLALVIDGVQLKIDADGFLLKKQNETLKKLMSDLFAAIKAMVFTTNNGPTINLVNLTQFEALETRFNDFLKDS